MSIESEPEERVAPRADLVSAVLWMAFGGLIAVGAWRMDRLENLHINKYEIPGLVPGLLGAAILLLGAMLAARAIRQGALNPVSRLPARAGTARMALVFAAMLIYALLLVGHGLPFWGATFGFVSAFIFFFDRERQTALGRGTGRQLLLALACGAVASGVVSMTFQDIFYVRLP
jgi:hypothetical protein